MDNNGNETNDDGLQPPAPKKRRKQRLAYTSVHEEFDRIEELFNTKYRVIFANYMKHKIDKFNSIGPERLSQEAGARHAIRSS